MGLNDDGFCTNCDHYNEKNDNCERSACIYFEVF